LGKPGEFVKILIAEDDPFFRSLLAELLSPDFDVVICEDGVMARNMLLQENSPRMALLDWMMPGMTGPQLCRELRAHPKTEGIYLILLTAKNDSADIIAGLRAGADDYTTKPFVTEELRARVRLGCRVLELQEKIACQNVPGASASVLDNTVLTQPHLRKACSTATLASVQASTATGREPRNP
jgi:DNA-binding response OmpR family regulator